MTTDRLGLYVHIPYCVRKCNYCDFCSLPCGRDGVPDAYVARLCDEIESYRDRVSVPLDTVYFGGGTPSLLSVGQMQRIFASIRDTFTFSPCAEITFEANPGTLTKDKARAFYKLGFNRISLGLQSIHEKEMKKLGRIHTYEEFLSCYRAVRTAGFDNVSVDLMYGIPYQTKESFEESVRAVVALSPEHISAYGLILEEGTPFFSGDGLPLPSLDDECDMYGIVGEILGAAGYEHYEISNYARDGFRSRHNSLYWHLGEYIGVGAAAHSFLQGRRFYNTDDVGLYIDGTQSQTVCDEDTDIAYEYVMLGLRLKEGISLADYERRFGRSLTEGKEAVIERLSREGLLILADGRIALTERGFYLSNSILIEIL